MRLVVENLGRIRHAQLDLRPLTVFVGPNGTNKTWVAHGLFRLLEMLRMHARQRAALGEIQREFARILDERTADLVRKAQATQGEARFEIFRRELVAMLPEELQFSLSGNEWRSAIGFIPSHESQLSLHLTRKEFESGVASRLGIGLSVDSSQVRTELFSEGSDESLAATDFSADLHSKVHAALEDLLLGWRRRVRVLPVEREHLAQVFSWLVSREVRDRLLMPRAHVDFCYLMNEARVRPGLGQEDKANEEDKLRTALHKVMGGQFQFTGTARELMFQSLQDGVAAVPVVASASLAKSLVGLEFFLRAAGPGDVLIVDEPEMNAHPQAQVALVELFALMIRAGVQIVAVTHSPYLLDHLSTLIQASRLDATQRARTAENLSLKSPEAFLRLEEIEVVQFGNDGKVVSLVDRDVGAIDWSTFTAVSDKESVTVNRILDEVEEGA